MRFAAPSPGLRLRSAIVEDSRVADADSNPTDARWFLTTRWSVVQAAGGDSTRAFNALERLCQTYWYPLYAYSRRADAFVRFC